MTKRRSRKPKIDFLKASQNAERFRVGLAVAPIKPPYVPAR